MNEQRNEQQPAPANLLPTDGDITSILVEARNRTTMLRYPGLTVLRRVWDVCIAREVSADTATAANAFALRMIREGQREATGTKDDVRLIGGLAVPNTIEGIAAFFDQAINTARSEGV